MTTNANLYEKIVLVPPYQATEVPGTRTYKGFSTVSTASENSSLFDLELIKQDLLNHFHVRQGERLMNPTFGTVIWDALFEPLTEELKQIITKNVTDIINYDPRIKADQVIVTAYESGIQIECTLTYLPYNISQSMRLSFDQRNGLLAE
jgi:phage baseplate assembly protein W